MSKYTEKQLRNWYKIYVEDKYFYRAFSEEYLEDIENKALNPKNNPYENVKDKILDFCKMLTRLDKAGFRYVYMRWPRTRPNSEILVRVFKRCLKDEYIDFTSNDFNELKYYKKVRGGSLPENIYYISKDLIKFKYDLKDKERENVLELLEWSKERREFKNKVIRIKATSEILNDFIHQRFLGQKWIPSCFGTYENFKKIINKFGFETYKIYLEGKEEYYMRTKNKIPIKEIEFVK